MKIAVLKNHLGGQIFYVQNTSVEDPVKKRRLRQKSLKINFYNSNSSIALAEISATLELVAEFQTIRIPVKGRFSDGRLKVIDPPVVLPPSFPGKKVSADVTVYSTFKETFEISHVVAESPINFKWQKYKDKEVKPMTRTKVK